MAVRSYGSRSRLEGLRSHARSHRSPDRGCRSHRSDARRRPRRGGRFRHRARASHRKVAADPCLRGPCPDARTAGRPGHRRRTRRRRCPDRQAPDDRGCPARSEAAAEQIPVHAADPSVRDRGGAGETCRGARRRCGGRRGRHRGRAGRRRRERDRAPGRRHTADTACRSCGRRGRHEQRRAPGVGVSVPRPGRPAIGDARRCPAGRAAGHAGGERGPGGDRLRLPVGRRLAPGGRLGP